MCYLQNTHFSLKDTLSVKGWKKTFQQKFVKKRFLAHNKNCKEVLLNKLNK